ncbi:restriction endonuclease subunit S [Psychroserpens damuponensis]|uniref:restriction endonuclease subunit S n=1 Tax=Psychroserpens damuponensis TaxID=943936 RepID=UPI000694FEC2|nr:restriction endonuclease subunit S [Psychroserpens damuponensis]
MQNNVVSSYSFLQFIEFTKFNTWDVQKNTYINEYQFENPIYLSEILTVFRESVSHKQAKDEDLRIISKIDFGGNLYLREKNEIEKYKGNLFLVPNNTIVYSKINVRHGCIYLNNSNPFVVSNEYPCFTFDVKKVDGDYLILLLRSVPFKKQINSLKVGLGKARVKVAEFLSLQIPLPSLDIQKSLVKAYLKNLNQADNLEQEATNLEEQIDILILKKLGIKLREVKKRQSGKLYFAEFNELFNWVHSADEATFFEDLQDAKYPVTEIGLAFDFISRPWKKKEESKEYIELGGIDPNFGVMKTKTVYAKKAPSRATQTVKTGDLIIGTTRPYLKKFAIIQDKNNGDVASSGFSTIQENKEKYNLYFLNEVLKSPIGIKQFEIKMTGALYPAITQSDLLELKIPLPSIDIQNKIAEGIQQMKDSQKDKFQQAQQLKKQALLDFENAIFKPAE